MLLFFFANIGHIGDVVNWALLEASCIDFCLLGEEIPHDRWLIKQGCKLVDRYYG